MGIWETGFGMAYAVETAQPTVSSSLSMTYSDINNPQNGVVVTGKFNNTTDTTNLANTGLKSGSKIKVTLDSDLTVTSVDCKLNGTTCSYSKSGNTATITLPAKFMNSNTSGAEIEYTINASVSSSSSKSSYTAKSVLSGEIISLNIATSYKKSFTKECSMDTKYKITIKGDSHIDSVSAGSNTGTTESSIVVAYGTNVTITGTAKTGYHVSSWSDGDTSSIGAKSQSRNIIVNKNCTYTCYTQANRYKVNYNKGSTM